MPPLNVPGTSNARRRLLQLLVVTASSWGLGGPVALAQPATSSSSPEALQQLRIGYQKSAANLVIVKQSGWLEKRFPNAKIAWIEFPAGPQLLEALSVGSLEFGLTGDSPPVFAQAAGKDLVYVGAEPPKPDSSAVLVLKDSPLKSLADLKGRKVALQKGSSAHYLLVRVVEKAGLQWSDIQPVYLAPADARAAFEKGSIDAWAIWDPFSAAAEKSLGARVLTDATGVVGNRAYYFSSLDYAAKNADVTRILIEELNAIDQWGAVHRGELAGELAALWGLPQPVVQVAIDRSAFGTGPITKAILAEQQQIADTFFELKLIPKKINVLEAAAAGTA